jgi:hypothetical protein
MGLGPSGGGGDADAQGGGGTTQAGQCPARQSAGGGCPLDASSIHSAPMGGLAEHIGVHCAARRRGSAACSAWLDSRAIAQGTGYPPATSRHLSEPRSTPERRRPMTRSAGEQLYGTLTLIWRSRRASAVAWACADPASATINRSPLAQGCRRSQEIGAVHCCHVAIAAKAVGIEHTSEERPSDLA